MQHEQQLIAAIQDIWDKATPYGPGIEEAGETWIDKYIMPAGPLHRAKGLLVSLSSAKTQVTTMQHEITAEMKIAYDEFCRAKDGGSGDYGALFDALEAIAPALRAQGMAKAREMLAHTDIGSLPNDWTLEQIIEARLDDLNKLRWQVIDTCKRAEAAEARAAEIPREPTEEMLRAAKEAAFMYPSDFARIFRAMFDAALHDRD
jgi:hypothetical protein